MSKPDAINRLLLAISKQAGTPTYVYFEDTIRQQAQAVKQFLADIPSRILYAMKANSHPSILGIMKSEGLGIDAVSPAELMLALRCGIPSASILYSGNNMTDDEMHRAAKEGVLINFGELSRLKKFGSAYPGRKVCIRINPERGSGHHEFVITAGKSSKFGIALHDLDQVRDIAATYNLSISGIHQHIGSGNLEIDVIRGAFESMLEVASGFDDLDLVNFGGGFGVPYEPGQEPIDFGKLSALIRPSLQNFLSQQKDGFQFLIEPGRYLVAQSGTLLATVTNLKNVAGRQFAGTNSGMNHLVRPAIYKAYHGIDNLSNLDAPMSVYNVVGNICESSDFFANDRGVQEIREGDIIAIHDAGAYGIAMASEYNLRSLPAEVLVKSDGSVVVISERQSPENLVDTVLGRSSDRVLEVE